MDTEELLKWATAVELHHMKKEIDIYLKSDKYHFRKIKTVSDNMRTVQSRVSKSYFERWKEKSPVDFAIFLNTTTPFSLSECHEFARSYING